MQALVQDYEQQIQSIVQSYEAAKAEEDIIQAAMHRHFAKCEAAQRLSFETARAEVESAASEEYNMLKISREAQVGCFVGLMSSQQSWHPVASEDRAIGLYQFKAFTQMVCLQLQAEA